MTITRKSGEEEDVIYPESDGKPMADNTRQFRYIALLKAGFDAMYIDRDDVFVAGDLLWYPVQGNNTIRYAPDVLIALGRPKGDRGSYLQWEENNQPPNVVFEVLSPSNTRKEMENKLGKYDLYGVDEYYEYDPDRGILQGWLRDSSSGNLEEIPDMDHWQSPLTKVTMHLEGKDLVVTRPDGRVFLNSEESEQQIQLHSKRAEEEAKRAEKEAKRAEKEAKRAEKEAKRAEKEAKRAEKEAKRAETATEQAARAEEEKKRLAKLLKEHGIDPS